MESDSDLILNAAYSNTKIRKIIIIIIWYSKDIKEKYKETITH